MKNERYFDGFSTPIGRLHVVVSDRAVTNVYLPGQKWATRYTRAPRHPLIVRAKQELKEYFSGKRKKFTLPLVSEGTVFQKKAWKVLANIPYGKTMSYTLEAKNTGSPRAVRAVASANGHNPLPILIPCHRVVPLSGGVGGYAGGTKIKSKLLELEKAHS